MKNRVISVYLVILALTGCITPEQREAREEQRQIAIEQKKQQYCANIGAPAGSDKYYDCRKWLEQEIATEQAQQNQAIIAAMPYAARQQPVQQPQTYIAPNPWVSLPRSTNCITQGNGYNSLRTNCQ